MQRLIVSIMRLSTAMTLYSYEQIQSSMTLARREQKLDIRADQLQVTIDSLSDVLMDNLENRKKETLSSVTSMAKDMVKLFSGGLSFMDPREMIKAAASMIERSSETSARAIGKATWVEGQEPKSAADVLS